MPRIFRSIHLTKRQKRWIIYVASGLGAVYLIATLFTWASYQHKFFPRSFYSGKALGNSTFSEQSLKRGLPAQVQLHVSSKDTLKTTPAKLGISPDANLTLTNLHKERGLSPVLAAHLVQKHSYPLGITINDTTLSTYVKGSLASFEQAPKDAHLAVDGETVKGVAAEKGKAVNVSAFKHDLSSHLATNYTSFSVPFQTKQASVQLSSSLTSKADSLNAALNQAIKINYTGGSYQPTKTEKAAWLSPSGTELSFDKTKISDFLNTLQGKTGQSWDNTATIASQLADKLAAGTGVSVTMHDKPKVVRTYSYCVALKDVDESFRSGFAAKIRSTYADPRGWGLNGKINFVEASSGCDFTIWLAAANDVPGFSPSVCDNYYSCTVSPNVIINFDRWQGATDPWNSAGGSLDDYHVMVINHETGHWLGFGHRTCPGAGQPAPVMQQQSISLQGCVFNPWPTPPELSALAQLKGV